MHRRPRIHLPGVPIHLVQRGHNLRDHGSIFEIYASQLATDWRRHLISFEPKMDPCRTCSVGFLSQDPKVLERVSRAWEMHVRNEGA